MWKRKVLRNSEDCEGRKWFWGSSLELNIPISFESESYTCAKFESEGVTSNCRSHVQGLGGRSYLSSTIKIYWARVGNRNNGFEKWNDAIEVTILKDTLRHLNSTPKRHNDNVNWCHMSGSWHAPKFQEIRSQSKVGSILALIKCLDARGKMLC